MEHWFRVFGQGTQQPPPEGLAEQFQRLVGQGRAHFRGDEDGWTSVDLVPPSGEDSLHVACYLASEPGIRAELNVWAASVESVHPLNDTTALMERIIQTRQLYTLRLPAREPHRTLGIELCQYLATMSEGIYQEDGVGFFAADGTLLLEES